MLKRRLWRLFYFSRKIKLMAHSLISINDLSNEEIRQLITIAQQIEQAPEKYADKAKGKLLALLFFEPSTRTYFSFQSAIQRLGGDVLGFAGTEATSVVKGESLEDTARMMACYSDIMAVRHAEIGAMQRMANVIDIPLINAGEGTAEHPTQTLTDLFTIYKKFGRFDITLGFYGDLKYRAAHSLLLAGSRLGINFICVGPAELKLTEEYVTQAKKNGANISFSDDIKKEIKNLDVLYVTRLQKERLPSHLDYEALKKSYIVDVELAHRMKESAIIMHPLPRINEIDIAVDSDPRAYYFQQAKNSVVTRMALLIKMLN